MFNAPVDEPLLDNTISSATVTTFPIFVYFPTCVV